MDDSTVIGIVGVDSTCTYSIAVNTEVLTRFLFGVHIEGCLLPIIVLTNIWEAIVFYSVGSSG